VLPARAENIAIVRHAFGALGDAFALAPQTMADIRLAVTEACTNVVVHAYPDDAGITPRADSPGLGLGLPLIASLASTVELRRDDRERTEVCMTFSLDSEDADHGRGVNEVAQ
jgi:anti-sigma regulatory factor (Ser/Thr protein kinase)